MQIYLHFVKHVYIELWFVWEWSSIVRYVEHGVSFLNEYVNYCPYDYRQSETEDTEGLRWHSVEWIVLI